ncbi:hypothetical protein E4U10_008113, partial [Claviceps purpurea]
LEEIPVVDNRTSSGATRPNIISTKSNENDAVNAQTHLEAKNAKDQMDKNPRKRKRNQIKGKGSDRTDPAKSNKVEKPGFSAKLTKRGKRQAKKPSDQNTTEGEAEKAIQNIKIWTHFDPKDPGSGVATLINTQLATVEYANKRARKQRLALTEVAVEELNALTIADRPLDARSNGKFQMKPISTLNKTERVNKRVRGTENAVLTATNKDAVVCLKGKGTTIPKNDGKSSDTDLTSYKPIVGNKRVRYDNAVVQKKPTRPAEDKDAAVHQKKNDIAVPGHNVVEVQQISTEPAEDILVPKTHMPKKNRSRTKKGKNAGVGPSTMRAAAGPSKVVKPGFAAKLTKRGRRMAAESVNQNPTAGEGPLSNGKNLIFRLPQLCKGVSDDDMIDIVSDSLEGGAAPVGISPVKKGTWSVAFATIEDARASIGREIRFEPRFGCDPAQSVPLERYLTSAPQVFICDRQGPITNIEAQQMIANAELLKDNRFWYGAHKRRGCEGPKRVLVLESPPETTTMTFLGPGEYELRFRPTNRRGNCELCAWPKGEGHNTLQCPLLMATNVPENMPMRLEEMPAIVSTIFENSTPIIPKHIPIKITTLNCRSLDFHQLSDLCRWMVMEGIAVAALQEVRLFKPELSLAEKTIQNIKIWTHFDPKDPGSGIATLINTQLATVEDYKLEKYLTSGPRIFICERQGPITNSEAQQLISSAEFLSGNKFWYGTYKRRGVEGAKRVLVLETPPEVTTMAFSGPNEYELRFRPENRKGKCELCTWPENKDHITLACKYLAGTTVPENMAMRLEEIPEMVSTISNPKKITPIIPKHAPIKVTTFNCRSLDFSQLSDLCRWMVMEGIAIAALQEVRLFKPELSLAEKAIQNIKIWTHFDPKDPGSGVATLINTQLATVEDYK